MKYGGMYWNPKEILPYQRNFNFINSVRNCGKSYSLAGFFIERWINRNEQFMFITRTVDERKNGALGEWVAKIMLQEFPQINYVCTSDTMYFCENEKKTSWRVMGHCRALSEAIKVKKQSFPLVKWACMDEYMLEAKHADMYVKGWNEPDLLLNLYHTIDREMDYVVMFLLGNNTAFYNPYHLHPAFNIPPTPEGKIWKSENVLFQWFAPPEEMQEKKQRNKFLHMIEGTNYGNYALEGKYVGDNTSFIENKTNRAIYVFAIGKDKESYGIWWDAKAGKIFVSNKRNLAHSPTFVVGELGGQNEIKITSKNSLIKWFKNQYMRGNVFYENMEIKLKFTEIIRGLI